VPPELELLSDADGAATLLHFTARAVAAGAALLPETPRAWYLCGGGRHNAEHRRALTAQLRRASVLPLEALGFDGDVTEAQAFAFLAVRSVLRLPLTYPRTTGAGPLSGGHTSAPATAP
jgi:anhydro-N-acetylmuramic acid kinase